MRVAIGSTRDLKVQAVKKVWPVFASKLLGDPDESVEFVSYDVSKATTVQMPLSAAQLMESALDRVESLNLQLKREKTESDFYVGLEDGFNIVKKNGLHRQVFLESWAYVSDGHQGYFGHSGGIYVPPRIASPVIDRGIELEIVIDRFNRENDIQSKLGAWGVLTGDLLTRKSFFVTALIAAFAPFYNTRAYQ